MENYPEQMPLMVYNGKLENLLDQRMAQATEQFDIMQKSLQEKMKVQNLSFQERVLIGTENPGTDYGSDRTRKFYTNH